jgi:hypothetical protein
MKNSIFLIFCLTLAYGAFSQDNTLGRQNNDGFSRDTIFPDSIYTKLMIIPFEPKMYRSEVDRQIGEHDGINFQEVRGYFRLGLDNAMYLATKKEYDVVRMHDDKADINRDLNFIYKSIAYQYKEVPRPEEKKKTIDKVADKLKKKEEKEEPGTRVENGQLKTVKEEVPLEKFMTTEIINPGLFPYLKEKYSAGLFLFINQLDIKPEAGLDYRDYESENYRREIKVHYTIFDAKGNKLSEGIAINYFSSKTNSIKKIISGYFPELGTDIAFKLPVLSYISSDNFTEKQ